MMPNGNWLRRAAAAGCLVVPLLAAHDATSQSAAEKAGTSCQNCHGPGGNSVVATFPRLNGQQGDYLAAQLKSFRSHTRADPHAVAYMWGMASQLDDAMIDALAKYFAAQPPTPPQSGGALAAEGQKIYESGAPADGVPPCQAVMARMATATASFRGSRDSMPTI